ncbi:MAG TPA: molybdopterin-dependent oxidoreductase, partial [Trebonia sp.]
MEADLGTASGPGAGGERMRSHASHWGAFRARPQPDGQLKVEPHELDPDPYPLIDNVTDAIGHRSRVDRPYVRRGWLEGKPRTADTRRGRDTYVPVSWDRAEEVLAKELSRVYDDHGASAVFGGSYGWASAGRFHHAPSQLHRFLNLLGGYTRSVNTYSTGAAEVLVPHVTGVTAGFPMAAGATFSDLTGTCELMVCFGGLPTKNAAVGPGGVTRHTARPGIRELAKSGCRFVSVSPLRDDLPDVTAERRITARPGTDTALMLALCHELIITGRADLPFLYRYTTGYERFAAYVRGDTDGVPKSPAWAARICDIPEDDIRWLAGQMSTSKTVITVTPSLQRAEHGEQPVWAGIALACVLGSIGGHGEGFTMGLGGMGNTGNPHTTPRLPSLPQGGNGAGTFIPVARITDLLLHPGEPFDYNGMTSTYPDIKLVYWAGGNPFHHHQDLFRLSEAFQRPDTVVVHESYWTATARHADIVLPATTTLEREDFSAASNDSHLVAMQRIREPYGQARDDYAIFAALSGRLGLEQKFTDGSRTPFTWLRHLYDDWRRTATRARPDASTAPDFDTFWERGHAEVPVDPKPRSWLDSFRADPEGHPLTTPSGKIELFSVVVDAFGYDDCPGHPAWLEPEEWLGGKLTEEFPLQLIANQPATRLHSQLDMGRTSREGKRDGREVLSMHPDDAVERGLADGDIVRVFSRRGAFLAALRITDGVRKHVARIPTGAWFDPDWETQTCVHGNPNAVTLDRGTSRLAQGSIGQLCLVQVEKFTDDLPPLRCHEPP